MSRAFVKEEQPGEPCCPRPGGCGGAGTPVERATVLAQIGEEAARDLAESAYYCPSPGCEVAYFDAWGKSVSMFALRCLIYPKSPSAPICPCFGVSAAEIRAEAEAGQRDRVREILASAEGPAARCATESPSGCSCAVEVRKIFMRHLKA